MTQAPALLFDLFGTLVQEFNQVRRAELFGRLLERCATEPLLPQFHEGVALEAFSELLGEINHEHYRKVAFKTGRSPDVRVAIRELLRRMDGAAAREEAVESFLQHYAAVERLYALPRMEEVLTMLQERGHPMALLSNVFFPGWIYEAEVTRLGISAFLPIRKFSSDMTYMKPHREAFLAPLRALGVAAEGAVMIGDNPELDLKTAAALGMQTIWLAKPDEPEKAFVTRRIGALTELPAALATLS